MVWWLAIYPSYSVGWGLIAADTDLFSAWGSCTSSRSSSSSDSISSCVSSKTYSHSTGFQEQPVHCATSSVDPHRWVIHRQTSRLSLFISAETVSKAATSSATNLWICPASPGSRILTGLHPKQAHLQLAGCNHGGKGVEQLVIVPCGHNPQPKVLVKSLQQWTCLDITVPRRSACKPDVKDVLQRLGIRGNLRRNWTG